MKIIKYILILLSSFLLFGCIPFASDEFNTKIWMSKKKRINDFKKQMDYQIGKELYSKKDKEQLCKIKECNYLSETVTEYIYKYVTDTNPSRICIYAWKVDMGKSEGDYQHEKGLLFRGLGKKIGWRYLSNPDQCLTTIGFSGPW